jgi:hypothetical protein
MRFHTSGLLLAVPLVWASLTACQAGGRESGDPGGTANGSTSGNGSGGTSNGGTVTLPDGTVAKLLPARIRRLTNDEYDATVQALLGTQQTFAANLAVDARQSDFTRNDQQRVDPLLAGQYQAAAEELAAEAIAPEKLSTLVPCAIASGDRACAEGFIDSWVSKAFRRPLTDEDRTALLTVYDVGIEGGSFTDGIQLVIQAALQSASFLYHSEIGSGDPAAPGTMTGHEIAAELSYLFLGGPPDAALLTAADAGELATSEGRLAQAQRLLAMPEALPQLERLVLEWLGIDGLTNLAKDATLFPNWEELRPALLKETQAFVDEVMVNDGSRVSALIGANYTVVDGSQALNDLYGLPAGTTGKVTLEDNTRRGILTQPSFLARRGKDAESAPVPRGVTILRRVLCITVPDPASLNLNVVPPPPDPTQTTRERFAVHAADPDCASCHDLIDGVGFTFESYDAVGKYRTTDNGKPVDSTGYVDSGTDIDGDYANAVELVEAMSGSERVKKCVAGHFYRFASARSDEDEEDSFVEGVWGNLDAEQQDSVYELLLNFVKSDLFVSRRPE